MVIPENPGHYDHEIKRLQRRISQHTNPHDLIAFYGSSSIRLWVHLKEDLAPLNVINLGFGGSSFIWCIYHFDTLFKDIEPKQIVIYVGDNDIGQGADAQTVFERFVELKQKIRKRYGSIKIHFMSIKPSPQRDYLIPVIKESNRLIEGEVAKDGGRFINIYDKMLINGHNPSSSYFLSDLLHLNRRGYMEWKEVVRKHFQLDPSS